MLTLTDAIPKTFLPENVAARLDLTNAVPCGYMVLNRAALCLGFPGRRE